MAIFAIEGQEDRFYRISELYSPYPLHRDLELPVIRWHEPVSKTSRDGRFCRARNCLVLTFYPAFSPLFKLGLKEHPSLETIIERASSLDPHIRKLAFDHLIENLEGIYENYDPATFASAAFIPCGQTEPPESGTPQQVRTFQVLPTMLTGNTFQGGYVSRVGITWLQTIASFHPTEGCHSFKDQGSTRCLRDNQYPATQPASGYSGGRKLVFFPVSERR